MSPELLVVVLAAGASRRLGTSKQLFPIDGEPLLRRQCRCALRATYDLDIPEDLAIAQMQVIQTLYAERHE